MQVVWISTSEWAQLPSYSSSQVPCRHWQVPLNQGRRLRIAYLVGRGLYILFGEIIPVNVLNMGSRNWSKITHQRMCVIMQRWPGYQGRKWSWGHASGRFGRWSDVRSPIPGLRFSENYFIQHASGLPDAEYKNSMLLYLLEKSQRLINRGVKLIYFVWRIGPCSDTMVCPHLSSPIVIVLQSLGGN